MDIIKHLKKENIKKKSFTCIVCPVGCNIEVEYTETNNNIKINKENNFNVINIKGNQCIRGKEYVIQELINPARVITTTVKTIYADFPRLPVKTDKPVPLKDIFIFMKEINKITIDRKVKIGEIVAKNLCGSDINLIATFPLD